MDYLTFIENTKQMNPQERSRYFNDLSEDSQAELVEQGGELEALLIHTRMVIGAEMIEKEQNLFKREKMMKVYRSLEDEYVKAINE